MVHHNGESTKSHTIAVDNGGGKEGDREKGTPSSELDDVKGYMMKAIVRVLSSGRGTILGARNGRWGRTVAERRMEGVMNEWTVGAPTEAVGGKICFRDTCPRHAAATRRRLAQSPTERTSQQGGRDDGRHAVQTRGRSE